MGCVPRMPLAISNPFKKLKTAMEKKKPKRQWFEVSEMELNVDVDKGLRPGSGGGVEGASDKIMTDPQNVMDNWFLSSKILRAQRTSGNATERRKWEARRVLDPGHSLIGSGRWKYSEDMKSREWKSDPLTEIGVREERRRLEAALGYYFPSREDLEILELYWKLWVNGSDQYAFFTAVRE